MRNTGVTDVRSFDEVSAIVPAGPGRFEATVDPEWTIVGKPNGGYLLAMLGRAATAAATCWRTDAARGSASR